MRLTAQKQQPAHLGRKTTKCTAFLHRLSSISTNIPKHKKIIKKNARPHVIPTEGPKGRSGGICLNTIAKRFHSFPLFTLHFDLLLRAYPNNLSSARDRRSRSKPEGYWDRL